MLTQDTNKIIFDFSEVKTIKDWYVVNDGVMGGLSKGKFNLNDNGNALFHGYVTTENNGGFTSVRHSFSEKNVSSFKAVTLRLKGDGKTYQFRIKADEDQSYSYVQDFKTSGDWETITISFNSFYPTYRGNKLNKPNYSGEHMEEVTFLIGNKKKESFALEIESITLE